MSPALPTDIAIPIRGADRRFVPIIISIATLVENGLCNYTSHTQQISMPAVKSQVFFTTLNGPLLPRREQFDPARRRGLAGWPGQKPGHGEFGFVPKTNPKRD